MAAQNEEVYKQIIVLQQTIFENHNELRKDLDEVKSCLRGEIDDVKSCVNSRISPLEEKVASHSHFVGLSTKFVAWAGGSGGLLGFICWLFSFHNK